MTKALVAFAILSLAAAPRQQRPPANPEVYLASLGRDVMPLTGGAAINISNSPDYDNQPSFTPDGKAILFTSKRDGKQNDIYRYDIATKALTQLTHTVENEYSPTVTPDGKSFSAVRIEADGKTQRLWRFDLDGSNPRLVLENIKGVGYHAWLDATHLALFIVGANGQPATLQLADTTTGTAEMIDSNPGHGLAVRPPARGPAASASTSSPTLTYVCKTDPQRWVVKEFSLANKTPTVLADAVPGSEDLAWDSAYVNRLLMTKGSKIFVLQNAKGPWQEAGDFTAAGIDRLTRIAINPDTKAASANRLAFVAEPVSK